MDSPPLDKARPLGATGAMQFSAVIVAAGSGTRAGGETPKQWRPVAAKPVARWALEGLLASGARQIAVVVRPGEEDLARTAFEGLDGYVLAPGGAERSHSVANGLAALTEDVDAVLIHDAARPFVGRHHVMRLLQALRDGADGALPGLAVTDTLKRTAPDGLILETPSREGLWRAQTPQAFRKSVLLAAYARASATATDDAALVEAAGGRVVVIEGDPLLMKLTYPEDFPMAERLAPVRRSIRVGQGFDAHRWGPGEAVYLCGVRIDHDQSLIGHSDADAGLHALTDALLGALGAGDIGDHFPPTDPKWKGAPSDLFARFAAELVRKRGGVINQVDVTLICERPRIKPHREAMRVRLAEILDVDPARVSVKATTTEGMGFTGRGEGLAAQALATLELPD